MVSAFPDGSLSFWDVTTGSVIKITKKVHEGVVDTFKYLSEIDVLV